MRNEKRWIASLVAMLLVVQCFTLIPMQMQKVYADTVMSPTRVMSTSTELYGIHKLDTLNSDLSVFSNQLIAYDTATTAAISIPTNVNVASTDTTLTVSWDAVANALSYDISLDGNITNTTDQEYTYDNLQPNTIHIVKVRAVKPFGIYGLTGDVNIDGAIDALDFALLKRYLLTNNLPIIEMLFDINEDGTLDALDGALIKRKCLGAADVNGDGTIDAIDFALLKKKLLQGSSYNFPISVSAWSAEIVKCTSGKFGVTTAGFIQVATSGLHTVALKEDGTVWTWGYNCNGQLGDGTENDSSIPVKVEISEVVAVAAIYTRTVVIKKDGTVWAWGDNEYGQLGSATTADISKIPVQVQGISDVKEVSLGAHYTIALKKDGTVWKWGYTGYEVLEVRDYDFGVIPYSCKPLQMGIYRVKAVSAGEYFTVALKEDGTVWAWGNNSAGQLGNTATTDIIEIPVQIEGISGVKKISAGETHTVAIKEDGTVWAWGEVGLLGNTTVENGGKSPVQVLCDIKEVSAGKNHTVAVKEDGTVWTWGSNTDGELGVANNANGLVGRTPVQVVGMSGVKAVATFWWNTVAIKEDGTVWSWGGHNNVGERGNGTIHYISSMPIQVKEISNAKALAAGRVNEAIYIKEDGTVWALGDNFHGQIDGISEAKAIAEGYGFSIVLKEDGTLWSWGENSYGQLGNGTTKYRETVPGQIEGLSEVKAIATGSDHTVALKEDGTVWTWGLNSYGQLGNGTTQKSNVPVQVAISEVKAVAAGGSSAIALKEDGTVWTWGNNSRRQLGNGTTLDSSVPIQVEISGVTAVSIGVRAVVQKEDGTVWTWGNNSSTPIQIAGISEVKEVYAGEVLKEDGTVWTMESSTPALKVGINGVTSVATYNIHTVALREDGTVWIWGSYQTGKWIPQRATYIEDANLKYILVDNLYIQNFDENTTDYTVELPTGVTSVPLVTVDSYNPLATHVVKPSETEPNAVIITVTAQDGVTQKNYKIHFTMPK